MDTPLLSLLTLGVAGDALLGVAGGALLRVAGGALLGVAGGALLGVSAKLDLDFEAIMVEVEESDLITREVRRGCLCSECQLQNWEC